MTNDRKYMDDIFLCPQCGDGYMIVKKSRDSENRFFGCTNHKPDGTGCNHVELLKKMTLKSAYINFRSDSRQAISI